MSDNLIRDADKNADSVSELQAVARLAQRMRSYLYTITNGKTIVKLARSLRLPLMGPECTPAIHIIIRLRNRKQF